MTELSGTLDGVGLPAIVRFLNGLKKTGRLHVAHGDWRGEILFEDGRVTGASLGSCSGLSALDALAQALPNGTFEFDTAWRPQGGPTIQLGQDVFEAHLKELASGRAGSILRLPPVDAVPMLLAADEPGAADEQLSLDRGTLQTLLAVDGQRTVRAIVAERGSFDALWQLGRLMQAGLVGLSGDGAAPTRRSGGAAELEPSPAVAAGLAPMPPPAAEVVPSPSPALGGPPDPDQAPIVRPFGPAEPQLSPPSPVACPRLGFEDDPSTSFGRPTRLHRCFAVGQPLPLSLDQQRELCLDEQFATCPRLAMSGGAPAARVPAPGAEANQPAAEDGRIVRWPFAGRARPAARTGPTTHEPAPGGAPRPASTAAERAAASGPRPAPVMRSERAVAREGQVAARTLGGTRAGESGPPAAAPGRAAPAEPGPGRTPADPALRGDARRGPTPERTASGPGRPAWRTADRAPGAGRPAWGTAQRVAAGEATAGAADQAAVRPGQAALREAGLVRPTPLRSRMAERPPVGQPAGGPLLERSPGPAGDPSRPEPEAASQPAGDAPGERRLRGLPLPLIGAAAGAVVVLGAIGYLLPPRLAPLLADDTLDPARLPNTSAVAAGTPVAQLAVARPTPAAGAPEQPASTPGSAPAAASGPSGAQPQPTSAPGATLLDERFGPATTGWPTTSQRTAWLGDDSYQLATRRAGQFVAISAPLVQVPSNVVVSATFHKVGGPAGGGYGIIVRDQGPDAQDGVSQAGRYYVLEVGDKGEAGIWRRETDHWVDLFPWQRTDAVKPGTASNELTVRAIGNVLSLVVNGVEVGARTDATYPGGRVGIFVGGDGNQVALERFTVQTP